MRYWIVKGNPAMNDWDDMLKPGTRGIWYTRRRPKDVEVRDRVFFWESSPECRPIALGAFVNPDYGEDEYGDTLLELEYATRRLRTPLTIDQLRRIPALEDV